MAQLTGKFVCALPVVEGENNGRFWKRGGFVMETLSDQPRQVALTLFGEERLLLCSGLKAGDIIVAEYSPESRQVGDRWFTDLKCYSVLRTQRM